MEVVTGKKLRIDCLKIIYKAVSFSLIVLRRIANHSHCKQLPPLKQ